MLGTETVYLSTGQALDSDNNPTSGADPIAVHGCLVENATVRGDEGLPDELRGQATGSVASIRIYMPITSGVSSTTALKVRGKLFQVVGDPEAFINDEDPELCGYVVLAKAGRG